MRQLTFRGFVTQYVQSLSLTGTLSLSKLFEEMTTQNARLKAPLFAYAVESGKLHTLLNVCRENQAVFAEYTALYEMLNKNEDVVIRHLAARVPEGVEQLLCGQAAGRA